MASLYAGELHQLTMGLMDIGALCSFISAWRLGDCEFMLTVFPLLAFGDVFRALFYSLFCVALHGLGRKAPITNCIYFRQLYRIMGSTCRKTFSLCGLHRDWIYTSCKELRASIKHRGNEYRLGTQKRMEGTVHRIKDTFWEAAHRNQQKSLTPLMHAREVWLTGRRKRTQ
jgi:hypothetical protein